MKSTAQRSHGQRGFTLIEIMIVVLIVAILAAVALPAYQDSVRKGRRASAQGFLMEVAQREQQYFIDSRTFTADLADMGITVPDDVADYYTITVELDAGPPADFTVVAAPKTGPQAVDGKLTIDRSGKREPEDKW